MQEKERGTEEEGKVGDLIFSKTLLIFWLKLVSLFYSCLTAVLPIAPPFTLPCFLLTAVCTLLAMNVGVIAGQQTKCSQTSSMCGKFIDRLDNDYPIGRNEDATLLASCLPAAMSPSSAQSLYVALLYSSGPPLARTRARGGRTVG